MILEVNYKCVYGGGINLLEILIWFCGLCIYYLKLILRVIKFFVF